MVTGVDTNAQPETNLVRLRVIDRDQSDTHTFAIDEIRYYSSDGSSRPVFNAFAVGPRSGVVTANMEDGYAPYAGGFFQVNVSATNQNGETARGQLFVSEKIV